MQKIIFFKKRLSLSYRIEILFDMNKSYQYIYRFLLLGGILLLSMINSFLWILSQIQLFILIILCCDNLSDLYVALKYSPIYIY
mgnify:CR=1 FL=1